MNNIVRLTESQLKKVIKESVRHILKEMNYKELLTEGADDDYVKKVIANSCDDYYKPYLQTSVNELPEDLKKSCEQSNRSSFKICSEKNESLLHYFRYDLLFYFDINRGKGPVKYIKGIARIACEELGMFNSQRSEGELAKFKQNVLFVYKKPELLDVQFNKNLNGLDFYDFTRLVNGVRREFNVQNKRNGGNLGTSDYTVVQINSFEEARKFGKYTEWCVTQDNIGKSNFDRYTQGGNRFYFCLQNGFESVPRQETEGCPLDAYGLSMISVLIDLDGEPVHITTRWNHDNDGEDNENLNTKEQFEKLTNIDWDSNFSPYTPEERKEMGLFTLMDFDLTEGEYIDMGFKSGTKWCSHNYGAKNPREHGGYYTWDDAQNLGIQLPSKEQFEELTANTESHWVSKGRIYISKTNGNSIFIPAAGYARNGSLDNRGYYGYVWSSSLYAGPYCAWVLYFSSDSQYVDIDCRCRGFSARGVVG